MQSIDPSILQSFAQSIWLAVEKINDIWLLGLALTHKSYAADFSNMSDHNERLEFVGDAILWSAIATLLFKNHPERSEAEMTLYKIALVREETLAIVAQDVGIQDIVLISKGEEKSGGRQKAAILSDTLEALIGYIALDLGYEAAYHFIERWVYSKIQTISPTGVKSYKTQLQELMQKKYKIIPHYVDAIENKQDTDNNILYRSDVFIWERLIASGFGTSKKKAQDDAAHNALDIDA